MLTIHNFEKISGIKIGNWKVYQPTELPSIYRMLCYDTTLNGKNYPMIEVEIYRDVPSHGVQVVGHLFKTPRSVAYQFTLSVSRKNISTIDRFETLLVLLINHLDK